MGVDDLAPYGSSMTDTDNATPTTRTGRCLCGAVTYELTGDPIAVAVCHCDHRQSGGAFSVNMVAHESQLAIDGSLSTYVETGENDDGEYVRRRFCPECGSPVVSELALTEGIVAVKVGTLDDRTDVRPMAEVWCVDKQPWVELPGMMASLERE